jgi:hypothetical protein
MSCPALFSLSFLLFLLFSPQDFPYYFEEGMEHHVLWSSTPLDPKRVVAEAAAGRDPDGTGAWEWVHFVNPTLLKSVPGIWHAHIISRRRPGR